MVITFFNTLSSIIQSLFGNIFIVCAGISLILLIAELIYYRIKAARRN